MTYVNLILVLLGIAILAALLGTLAALTDDKVRQKIRLSPQLRKKRKHLND